MVIKYIIGIVVGYIVSTMLIMVLTVLRFGIPLCNELLREKEDEMAVKELKKKYYISLAIWTPIITTTSLICYNFLDRGFYGYIISIIFMLVLGFKSTGNNVNNMNEFHNSLQSQKWIISSKNK